jgi:hypothetical protein
MEPSELSDRARWAYERARMRSALVDALALTPLVLLALFRCQHLTPTCLASVALLGLTAGFRYRGGIWGRSVVPALISALPALLIPPLLPASMVACVAGHAFPPCLFICPLAGLFAGALLGTWSARQGPERDKALVAGTAILLACGTLGCGVFGITGVAGLLVGAVASTPIAILALRMR